MALSIDRGKPARRFGVFHSARANHTKKEGNQMKTKKVKKLELNRESLRRLADDQLAKVDGAGPSDNCSARCTLISVCIC